MTNENPGFWLRLMWAFRYFFLVLTSAGFARQVAALDQQRQITAAKSTKDVESAARAAMGTAQEGTAQEKVQSEPQPTPVDIQAPVRTPAEPAPAAKEEAVVEPAQPVLQLLGLLQQEARFVDFLQEDVTQFSDNDIGAAARIVHGGCRKVLQQYMALAPVMNDPEQSRVTLAAGFDPAEIRLTGRVSGQGPFSGTLMHRGWKVTRVELPAMAPGHNAYVLAPAEVEV